jgi:proteic killer suppression protein
MSSTSEYRSVQQLHHAPGYPERAVTVYDVASIKSFRHKGIEKFFLTGSLKGIRPQHSRRLSLQLFTLNQSAGPDDMNLPVWDWHPLKGKLAGLWSVSVDGNWRLTYGFEGENAILVDYQDYH